MSRDKRDQRGGHRLRNHRLYNCQCCEVLSPKPKSTNRTERNRSNMRYELKADNTHH